MDWIDGGMNGGNDASAELKSVISVSGLQTFLCFVHVSDCRYRLLISCTVSSMTCGYRMHQSESCRKTNVDVALETS